MPADHGDATNLGRIKGQDRFVVFEKHDAFFFQMLGDIQPALHIDDAFLDGMIHNAGKELGIKNPARVVINIGHRHFAVLHCLYKRRPKEIGHGLFLVQAGRRSLLGAVRSVPIGDDETLISPILLQNVMQDVGILTGVVAVDAVIGTHHRARDSQSAMPIWKARRSLSCMARLEMIMFTMFRPVS